MDSDYQYHKLFESYFSGDMSEMDQVLFEARLASEPAMKAAFERQQDIVNALRAHRSAELKARLNHITIHPWSAAKDAVTKYVAYGVMSLAVVAGGYWLYPKAERDMPQLTELPIKIQPPEGVHFDVPDYTLDATALTAPPLVGKPAPKQAEKPAAKRRPTASTTPSAGEIPEAQLTEESNTAADLHIDLNIVNRVGETPEMTHAQGIEIDWVDSSRHRFHYKLEDYRLFLYGKFDEAPYEIIEINTEDYQRLFFYYQNHFYRLKRNASRITRLTKIKNQSLIKRLEALRSPAADE